MLIAAFLDQLATRLRHGDDHVAQHGQDRAVIFLHVRLVVGDGDAQPAVHGLPRGMMMDSAPGPTRAPSVIRPLWASTMARQIARPSPVPFVLVV